MPRPTLIETLGLRTGSVQSRWSRSCRRTTRPPIPLTTPSAAP